MFSPSPAALPRLDSQLIPVGSATPQPEGVPQPSRRKGFLGVTTLARHIQLRYQLGACVVHFQPWAKTMTTRSVVPTSTAMHERRRVGCNLAENPLQWPLCSKVQVSLISVLAVLESWLNYMEF